jgi:hypothetical protein
MPALDLTAFDYVLLIDAIQRVGSPERLVDELKHAARYTPELKIIVAAGNIGFVIARLSLLLGRFNYSKRGLLDLSHARLFTFHALRKLFEQAGFDVLVVKGTPAPFPLALGDGWAARLLLAINRLLIGIRAPLFAFQAFMVMRPRPSLPYLLAQAHTSSRDRAGRAAAE